MDRLHGIDVVVLLAYVAGVVAFGCWFVRRSQTTRGFTTADSSLPGWAVGLSIFGTYLSSNTFLGVPGIAYASNWNAFTFSLSLPFAAWIAGRYFVPFYRRQGEISAYQHLEQRFGAWARTYAVVCYLLTQMARTGSIMFGVSLGLSALTGWDQATLILCTGVLVTSYTLLGGITAVIWTDVVQSVVLMIGAVAVTLLVLFGMPEGPVQAIRIATEHVKFELGDTSLDFTTATVWVVLLYGLFINLNNFGIDQSYVQRYHAARTTAAAVRSVWIGALLYLPVSLLFFFLGSCLFSFYQAYPERLGDLTGDEVLPHFLVSELPTGFAGLLIAAIFAAAMSSIDTSLNSSATVTLTDLWRRYVHPTIGERGSMQVLRGATIVWGLIGTGVALLMIGTESVLDAWWRLSGIFAGGMLGLFLLGLIARRAGNAAGATGVAVGVLVIGWMTFSPASALPEALHSPFHAHMTTVVGTLSIFAVGLAVSRLRR